MAGRSELDALLDLVGAGDEFLFDDKKKKKKSDKKDLVATVSSTVVHAVHTKHLVEKALHHSHKTPDPKPGNDIKFRGRKISMLSANGLLTSTPKGDRSGIGNEDNKKSIFYPIHYCKICVIVACISSHLCSNRLMTPTKKAKGSPTSLDKFRPSSPERTPENCSVIYLSRVRRLVREALLENGFALTYKGVREHVEKALGTLGYFDIKPWRDWFRTTVDNLMKNEQFHQEVLSRTKTKAGLDMLNHTRESAPATDTANTAAPKRKDPIDFGEEQHYPEDDDYYEDGGDEGGDYEDGDYEEGEEEYAEDDGYGGDDGEHGEGDHHYDDTHHGEYGEHDEADGEYDGEEEYYEDGDYEEEDDNYEGADEGEEHLEEEEETLAEYKARMRTKVLS